MTPRDRVTAELGQPDVIWEPARVHVYEEGPSGGFIWVIPAGYSASIFITELGEDVVLIKYDENDKIEYIDRQVGPVSRSNYGNFLREWLAKVTSGRE